MTVEQHEVVGVEPLRRGWDEVRPEAVPSTARMLDLAREAEAEGCFLITHYDET